VGPTPETQDDQISGLSSVQSAPRPIGLEDPVQSAMTAATERDQIPTGFTPKTLVGAVMQVVTERPFCAADETVWFGAMPSGPLRRPTLPQRKPLLAGHVVAIGGTAMKATSRPHEFGRGLRTARPTLSGCASNRLFDRGPVAF
jgi:hypothetical protein